MHIGILYRWWYCRRLQQNKTEKAISYFENLLRGNPDEVASSPADLSVCRFYHNSVQMAFAIKPSSFLYKSAPKQRTAEQKASHLCYSYLYILICLMTEKLCIGNQAYLRVYLWLAVKETNHCVENWCLFLADLQELKVRQKLQYFEILVISNNNK